MRRAAAFALAALAAGAASASQTTVCTITVNSADEREAFREFLPPERYRFVELAGGIANAPAGSGAGRDDWLGSACRAGVRCDVLVISGHFAGTQFYSSKHGEHLPVEAMERVACSDSCPGLFSQLREVYLFGCDTLKPEPVKSATPEIVRSLLAAGHSGAQAAAAARALSERHAESARDRMRRLFPGVPVIYGFASLAPYGRVAGPMLRGYLESGGAGEVGRGEPSRRLLKLFGPASMVATAGLQPQDRDAADRAEACRFSDERVSGRERLAFVRDLLAGDVFTLRMTFDRIERFFALAAADLSGLAGDTAARGNYLAATRATHDPALRVRMIALARRVGWLDDAGERAELAAMIGGLLAAGASGYAEVDLICGIGGDGRFEAELARFDVAKLARTPANAAALACLGSAEARRAALRAVASAGEDDVRAAQAFLRHRPLADGAEIRALVAEVARMEASPAQVRALETIARQPLAGALAREELAALFARTGSLAVQRAVAEVFLREPRVEGARDLARLLRERRLRSPDGPDLIDALIGRLESA